MSESPESPVAVESPNEPRSAASVLGILGVLVALPLLIVALVLIVRGTGSSSGQADDLMEGVRENRIQAVYLSNERLFFGSLEAGEGGWLKLKDGYFLRQTAADEQSKQPASTDLVPVQQEVGGDGDIVINASEVTLVQNLAASSEIAKQIEDAAR